ncbi:activator of basal transcription 1 [Ciconia boyciana]|uniref:activator of basal transcription 1 n=1 Tax=Ciconia boyciana TaxID=52775 RepID=UPI003BA094B0
MAAAERAPPPREEEEEEEGGGGEGAQPLPPAAGAPPGGEGRCPPPRRAVPGVLYLPSLPPGFGPRHVRALLGAHGELGRVFLQPRGGRVRRRRRRPGGAGGSFAEGWVEFRDKRAAKRAAALLHGHPMAPRPRSPFRHHRWSLKYLPGFRWPHLSERLSWERRARGHRLRAEVAQAKREGGFFARPPSPPQAAGGRLPLPRLGFHPTPHRGGDLGGEGPPSPAAPPRRLLEKIFGGS